ncbi:hypothetical protein [Sphingomonas sp.]|uniref:hypothetical protein n=1 Tax=Sphingomonas sp. TaxID=28214 RepID=UPI001B11A3C6|nr:hypothetical protein [Sphingomonas sp.]MBO9711272.1 hypothetical protein [Sphingomonas sp.]
MFAAALALLLAMRAEDPDWELLIEGQPYWIDAAHIDAEGDDRHFTLRYVLADGSDTVFEGSADCRANTTDVHKFEVTDRGGRVVMMVIDAAVERELLALTCTVAG